MGIREDDKRYNAYVTHRVDLIKYATLILGSRADAEDVVQEAFLKFVPEGPSNPSNLKSYLFRIVRNLALDNRRRNRQDLRERPDDTPFWGLPQDHGTPEEHALFCDEVRQMQTILATLPVQSRVALEMHRFGGYNMEEIARHLGVSVATAHRLIKGSIAAITKEMQ
ncbi:MULTISPECIES: RNA polymerase sigma factor [unclassified Rhizobium]|uniref:RNA polymerase sigma factor n=1 Tax=unclassified Rhizobium TaxID=2613769 RepID=UPI00247B232C|nr:MULTISPECIES: RNA polymerase sigma factor [unclassified Rhizobium]MDH7802113.1 RNA polymerase sigma factor (sigma-70 family) [Rhizobium sp. AN70]